MECGTENRPGARTCEFCNAALPTGPGLPQQPPGPDSSAAARKRLEKSRRAERWAAPALGVVAVVMLGLLVVFFPKGKLQEATPDLALDYPTVTIDRYYGALEDGDYAKAYEALSSEVRAMMTEEQFATLCQGRTVTAFSIKDSGPTEDPQTYAAVSVNGTPTFLWLVHESEGWRIAWTPQLEQALGLPCPV